MMSIVVPFSLTLSIFRGGGTDANQDTSSPKTKTTSFLEKSGDTILLLLCNGQQHPSPLWGSFKLRSSPSTNFLSYIHREQWMDASTYLLRVFNGKSLNGFTVSTNQTGILYKDWSMLDEAIHISPFAYLGRTMPFFYHPFDSTFRRTPKVYWAGWQEHFSVEPPVFISSEDTVNKSSCILEHQSSVHLDFLS
jgi:hypothetical protein